MAKKKGKTAPAQAPVEAGLSAKVRELVTFFEESKVEIKKVVWPTRKETVATSVAVVVVTVVIALYLGLVDLGWSYLVQSVLS